MSIPYQIGDADSYAYCAPLCNANRAPLCDAYCAPLRVAYCAPLNVAYCAPLNVTYSLSLNVTYSLSLNVAHSLSLSVAHCLPLNVTYCAPLSTNISECNAAPQSGASHGMGAKCCQMLRQWLTVWRGPWYFARSRVSFFLLWCGAASFPDNAPTTQTATRSRTVCHFRPFKKAS